MPKVTDDFCVVNDGIWSGLDDAIWFPWFPLPAVSSMSHEIVLGTLDVGQ